MGYEKIAVTVVSADDTRKLRELESQHPDVKIYIFVAHSTEVSREDAEVFFDDADVVTSCASKHIRDISTEREVFHAGDSIPIFGITEDGIKLLKIRIEKIGGLKEKKDAKIPKPLI